MTASLQELPTELIQGVIDYFAQARHMETPAGFIARYEANLLEIPSKRDAYYETERQYRAMPFHPENHFNDYKTFVVALSKYNTKRVALVA